MELGGFGVERATKRAQWAEALDAVTRMLVEEPFAGYDGEWVHVPPRNVVPKPLQRPHPPLWVACSRRETIHLAATKGIGALSFSFVEAEEAEHWVDDYYATIASAECVPAGFAVNPALACVLPSCATRDEAEAVERGLDGGHFFGYSLAHYYVFGDHQPGRHRSSGRSSRRTGPPSGSTATSPARWDSPSAPSSWPRGSGPCAAPSARPTQIRELVRRYEAAGVDQLIFVSQAGRNRHEHICESLELFAAEVMPEFAERARRTGAGQGRAPGPGHGGGARPTASPQTAAGRLLGACLLRDLMVAAPVARAPRDAAACRRVELGK